MKEIKDNLNKEITCLWIRRSCIVKISFSPKIDLEIDLMYSIQKSQYNFYRQADYKIHMKKANELK